MLQRVAIGATFACDDTLELPLQLLLREAIGTPSDAVSIDIEWLPYGSAAQFAAWMPSLKATPTQQLPPRTSQDSPSVELVLLLVRVSDLEAAHPEQLASLSPPLSSEPLASKLSPSLEQFAQDVVQYRCSSEQLPPLVVIMSPSPPAQSQQFLAAEHALYQRIHDATSSSSRHLHWLSSLHALELFRQHNPPPVAFYNRVGDQLQHAPYTQRMLNTLSFALCRQICRLQRPASLPLKKVMVLDCDNTLWGGAVAEVGVNGIALTAPFLALQRFVVAQQQRGMLVCLCSKNTDRDVVAVFEQRRSDMVLQLDAHIARRKVNWMAKSRNIAELAQELELGLEAFVFIDDNPLECSEVASALPLVTVISVPSGFAPGVLDHEWVFDTPITTTMSGTASGASAQTAEDTQRTAMYQQQAQRQELQRASRSHRAFLSSLGVKIVFESVEAPHAVSGTDGSETVSGPSQSFTRVLQLHQRTNQFNTATSFARALTAETLLTYTEAEDASATSTAAALCAHVTDRFGHYGLVSVVLCRLHSSRNDSLSAGADAHSSEHRRLDVDTFLLSCRALNRGVEHAMVRRVAELAERLDAPTIAFAWEPTDRNEPARLFFASLAACSFTCAHLSSSRRNGGAEAPLPRVQSRDEKLRLSATHKGVWTIDTAAAAHVAFLKTDDEDASDGAAATPSHEATELSVSYTPGAWTAVLSRVIAAIARVVQAALVRIMKGVLPTWLVSFVAARFRQRLPAVTPARPTTPAKLLCESFREPDALNAFIAKHTQLALASDREDSETVANGSGEGDADADAILTPLSEQEASKFRRKARHQTKLALLGHLSVDAPDVIWSANHRASSLTRQGDAVNTSEGFGRSSGDVPAADHVSPDVLLIASHKPCATPLCAATVGLQSTCGFQRCRTCCYKIQRLLERLRTSSHETAKRTAQRALVEQFAVTVASDDGNEVDSACPAHRNGRRRH